MCPIVARESVEIPVQRYTGEVESVQIRNEQNKDGKPVQYVEMDVNTHDDSIKGWNGHFKVSFPANLTKQTELGKFLNRMKIPFVVGQAFDEQSLVGLSISFDTIRNGYFTNPVIATVGPADDE